MQFEELVDYLYASIIEKKTQVDIIGNFYDADLNKLVAEAIKKSGINATYSINSFYKWYGGQYVWWHIVYFTYPQIKSNTNPSINNDKVVHLYDDGTFSFIYQLDVMKGNIIIIQTKYLNNTLDILKNHQHTLIGVCEGVDFYSYDVKQNNGNEATIELNLKINIPYDEFVRRIRRGEQKAYDVARALFNGVICQPELYCLIATAYLQLNVRYDYDYLNSWEGFGSEKQVIDNHTCYGSLVLGRAVCEGYSWGLIKILRALGLEAIPETGIKDGRGHEWTKVKINGEWYNIDPTIDPNPSGIIMRAFLVSDNYLRSCGYQFEAIKYKATNTKFETEVGFRSLISTFDLYKYERAGVSSYYLRLPYIYCPVK